MIKCFITLCMVANPTMCLQPLEITPADHPITSTMECTRGAFVYFSQPRMAQQTPEGNPPNWFPKVDAYMEGDGSDIVSNWVRAEKARLKALEPQIK